MKEILWSTSAELQNTIFRMLCIGPSVPRCVSPCWIKIYYLWYTCQAFLFFSDRLLQATFPCEWMSWEVPSYRPVFSTQQRQATHMVILRPVEFFTHIKRKLNSHNLLYHWTLYLPILAFYNTGFISHFKQLSCSKAAVWCYTQCSLPVYKEFSDNIGSPGHILRYNKRKIESSLHKEVVEFVLVW